MDRQELMISVAYAALAAAAGLVAWLVADALGAATLAAPGPLHLVR